MPPYSQAADAPRSGRSPSAIPAGASAFGGPADLSHGHRLRLAVGFGRVKGSLDESHDLQRLAWIDRRALRLHEGDDLLEQFPVDVRRVDVHLPEALLREGGEGVGVRAG